MHVLYSTDDDFVTGWLAENPDALSIDVMVVRQAHLIGLLVTGLNDMNTETSHSSGAAMLYTQMNPRFDSTRMTLDSYAKTLQIEVENYVRIRSRLKRVSVTVTLMGYGQDDIQKCFVHLIQRALTPA
jgi:hypothetical protein